MNNEGLTGNVNPVFAMAPDAIDPKSCAKCLAR